MIICVYYDYNWLGTMKLRVIPLFGNFSFTYTIHYPITHLEKNIMYAKFHNESPMIKLSAKTWIALFISHQIILYLLS